MILQESKLLRESINQYLILESRQILFENIKNNPKKYFVINEDYKKHLPDEDYELLEEAVWDTIKNVASSAWESLKDTGSKIGDWFSENTAQGIQSIADIVSIFDPTGIVDLVNGIFYYYFKDYFSAFFSFLGAALTMGGLLLTATGAGAVAGVPMVVAGKATKAVKYSIKAGKISGISGKEIGITAKIAKPAILKVASIVEKVHFGKGISSWLAKSTDNVATLASKQGSTMDDVAKALNSTTTEISSSPVVKSLTGRVVDAVKKQSGKPSKTQIGFAGLGTYGSWLSVEDHSLQKIALSQMEEEFKKEGLPFDPNNQIVKKYLPDAIEEIKRERNRCSLQGPAACKSNFDKFAENYPITANLISTLGTGIAKGLTDFGQKGADVLAKTDFRNT